mgnify:FL=1
MSSILVDTNILIDYLKNPTDNATKIFEQNEIATCGVIVTELLRGSKSPKESEKLKAALDCFDYLDFEKSDWIEIAELFIKLKKSGVTVPFQDGIISYLAIKHNCKVWTKDCHFKVIQSVIPILELL